MSVLAIIEAMKAAGVSADQIIAAVKAYETKRMEEASSSAIRQQRYRERGGGKIPLSLRHAIIERDNGECQDCGSTDHIQIDHIHPVSKGGETVYDNLQVLCRVCNARKKDRVRKSIPRNSTEKTGIQGKVGTAPFPPPNPPLEPPLTPTHTRENTTRTREEIFTLPEWIPAEPWKSFMEVRKKAKAADTVNAKKLLVKELERLRNLGHDPTDLIEKSVRNSWKDIYEPKGNYHANTGGKTGSGYATGRANGGQNQHPKPTWASEADRLAAKYLAEADAEKRDEQRGQSATVLLPEPSMRSAAPVRQNGGGTGGNG